MILINRYVQFAFTTIVSTRTLFLFPLPLLFCNSCAFSLIHLPLFYKEKSPSSAFFSTSKILCKIGKKQGHDKKKLNAKLTADILQLKGNVDKSKLDYADDYDETHSHSTSDLTAEELAVKGANKLEECYNLLIENIAKHLTINVNLKTYEDIPVTLENNETHKLYKLARITMRNPTTIAINFADNPVAIKSARLALQSMGDNTNIQQDGIMLYIQVPKITRERREELANKVSLSIFNEYKLVLSQVYSKYNKRLEKSTKNKDQILKLSNGLLKEMRNYVTKGEKRIAERKIALLSEVL